MAKLKKNPLIFGLFLLIVGSLGYRYYKYFILSQEQEDIFRKIEKVRKEQREVFCWYKAKSSVKNSNVDRPKIVIRIERD